MRIDPSLVKPEEAEILEDLIVAAAADAKAKLDVQLQAKMQDDDGRPTAAARAEAVLEAWPMALKITSPAFADGASIPHEVHLRGRGFVAAARRSRACRPARKSLVLIVDDPDAPDPKAPKMTYVHWVLFDLPPDTTEIVEGMVALPAGTKSGLNDWKRTGYGGPCPPIGRHRYFFKLYALDTKLEGLSAATKADVVAAMQGHVLAEAQIVGTYQKAR